MEGMAAHAFGGFPDVRPGDSIPDLVVACLPRSGFVQPAVSPAEAEAGARIEVVR